MRSVSLAFFFLLAIALFQQSLPAAAAENDLASKDWPQWRGEFRDGVSRETGLNTDWENHPPKLVWVAEGLGDGFASVAVSQGRLYTTGNLATGQGVVAVNVADGSIAWTKPITTGVPKHSYQGSRSTPTVDGDRLYVIASDGTLVSLATEDGSILWRRSFKEDWGGRMMSGWGYAESPLVDEDRLICTPGGEEAMMVALDKNTGEEIWRCPVPHIGERGRDGAGYSSIVISHGAGVKQYVQVVGRGAIGVDAESGTFLWGYNQVANGTANIPTALVFDDYVFCSTGYRTGAALLKICKDADQIKADEIYFLPANILENHHGGMVRIGDHIYGGHKHNQGFPTCLEWQTGKIAWGGERGPGTGSAAVAAYESVVVFRYQNGDVALIEASPAAMRIKGVFKPTFVQGPSWAHPVIADGKLYLREQDRLMCYDLRQ